MIETNYSTNRSINQRSFSISNKTEPLSGEIFTLSDENPEETDDILRSTGEHFLNSAKLLLFEPI